MPAMPLFRSGNQSGRSRNSRNKDTEKFITDLYLNRPCRGFTLVEILVVLSILAALMALGFGGFRHLRRQAQIDATRALAEAVASAIAGQDLTRPARAVGAAAAEAKVVAIGLWDANRDGLVDGALVFLDVADPTPASGDPLWRDAHTNPDRSKGASYSGILGSLSPEERGLFHPRFASDAALRTALTEVEYQGFTSAGFELAERQRDLHGRPVDAWGRPLRFAYVPTWRRAGGGYQVDGSFLAPGLHENPGDLGSRPLAWVSERLGTKRFAVWSAGPDGIDGTADDISANP